MIYQRQQEVCCAEVCRGFKIPADITNKVVYAQVTGQEGGFYGRL